MLAGDLAAAEWELRRGVELLEGMGERAYLSTLGAMLADVLSRRHRLPGPLAGSQGQAPRQAGAVEPAEALGREAVRLAAPTDVLNLHGHCYLALGAVPQAKALHVYRDTAGAAVSAFPIQSPPLGPPLVG